jgi:hypothetical protein
MPVHARGSLGIRNCSVKTDFAELASQKFFDIADLIAAIKKPAWLIFFLRDRLWLVIAAYNEAEVVGRVLPT